MLSNAIRLAFALELLMVCGESTIPRLATFLPLGGTHLGQLGLLLILAIVVVDLWELFVSHDR